MDELMCIIGNAKAPQGNPITYQYSQFFITFIVKAETGEIMDMEVSTILKTTNDYIRTLFLGKELGEVDEALIETIRTHYLGSSQKALIVAYKDAVKKYRAWRGGIIITE